MLSKVNLQFKEIQFVQSQFFNFSIDRLYMVFNLIGDTFGSS